MGTEDDITLRAAIAQYKSHKGSVSNAYDWYRRGALRDGEVHIEHAVLKAWRDSRGRWCLRRKDFERVMARFVGEMRRCGGSRFKTEDYLRARWKI